MNEINNENKDKSETLQTKDMEYNNEPSTIKIGHKDINIYLMFILQQLMNGQKNVNIIARGMLVTKCILVAMVLKNSYMKDLSLEATIDMVVLGENNSNIPTINIKLSRPN